jgi:hypothetical protein
MRHRDRVDLGALALPHACLRALIVRSACPRKAAEGPSANNRRYRVYSVRRYVNEELVGALWSTCKSRSVRS